MTNYEELLAVLQQEDVIKAELLEEEVSIMVHKLKFLPADSFPSITILDQKADFSPLYSESLREKVKLAGGNLSPENTPDVIIILKEDDTLFGKLFSLLDQQQWRQSIAYKNNKVFIIENQTFDQAIANYLKDAEILAEIQQPKYFYFGHEGTEWVKFDLATR